MLDFRIDTFLTVCKYMNYTQAAHELNLTQPAVSQHIRCLEKRYGQDLFRYEKKKLSLTEAGEILLRVVTTTKSDEKIMLREMNPIHDGLQEYRIGATKTVGEYILLKPLAAYVKKHSTINIKLKIANTNELLQKLQDRDIGFAIIEGYYDPEHYDAIKFSTEKYVAVCSAAYEPKKAFRRLQDLCGERLLLREEGSGTRDIMEHNLAAHGIRIEDFPHKIEVNSLHAIVVLLKEGIGVSFVYEAAVREEIEKGSLKIIPLEDFSVEHGITFLWNRGSAYEDKFKEICRELKLELSN